MIYFLGQNRSNLHHAAAAAGDAGDGDFRGAGDAAPPSARCEGWGSGAGSDGGCGIGCWCVLLGRNTVWLRAGTGKGRFEERGDKACKSLDLALRLALGVDRRRYRLFLLICCLPALGFVDAPSGTAENDPSFSFIA